MDRSRSGYIVVVLVAVSLFCGGVAIGAADDGAPGDPASFYGEAIEEDGSEIPAGATIVAVVDGETKDRIDIENAGAYGGPGAFDDKLRIDSSAGEEVTFRLVGQNGSVGGTAPLEPGVFEVNLTFEEGSIEALPPEPKMDVDPSEAEAGETITFSAEGSTAYADTELVAFEWSIERDGETIGTFDGESVNQSVEESGKYDVRLNVTGDNNRTATVTDEIEIDSEPEGEATNDEKEEEEGSASSTDDGSDGTSSGGSSGGSSSSGGGSGGTSGGSSSSGGSSGSGSTGDTEDPTDSVSSSSQPILSETHDLDDQFPGSSGSSVVFEETSIREIVFEEESVSGEISIAEFEEPTDGTPPIPENGLAASASVIAVPEAHRETNATVRAVVSNEWLLEHDLKAENLTMYRLPDDGSDWEALPTETFEIDDGYMVEATTPGFSQFVVAGTEPPTRESSDPDRLAEEPDTTSGETSGGGDASETDEGVSSASDSDSSSDDGSTFGETTPLVPLIALCALLVAVAAIGRLFVPRRRDEW